MKKSLIITLFIALLVVPTTSQAQNNSTILKKTNKKISLICEKSCSKLPKTFSRAWSVVNKTLNKVENTFKMPVPIKLPIEVHIGYDSACAVASPELVKANTSKGFTLYKPDGALPTGSQGAMICINGSVKEISMGIMPLAHEITHLYFNTTRNTMEAANFEEKLVTSIAPCAWNCGARTMKNICGGADKAPDFANFCKNYDLEYSKIPLFIKRLADLRKNGQITTDDLKETLKCVQTH
jgi:hypothetical protein